MEPIREAGRISSALAFLAALDAAVAACAVPREDELSVRRRRRAGQRDEAAQREEVRVKAL